MYINLPPRGDEMRRENHFLSTLKVTPQPIPDMTVNVTPGSFWFGKQYIETMGGKSPKFTSPVSGSKWSLLYVNNDGYLRIIDGQSSSRPAPPDCPSHGFPLCFVYLSRGDSQVTYDKVFDVRAVFISNITKHNDLESREEANSHPIGSISGLQAKLDSIPLMTDFTSLIDLKSDLNGTSNETFAINKPDNLGVQSTTPMLIFKRNNQSDVGIRWNEQIKHFEYTEDGITWFLLGNVSFSPATDDRLGGIIVGEGLTIESNGTLNVNVQTANNYTDEDKAKLLAVPDNVTLMLNSKVDRIFGKGLSTNDYTNSDKQKVDLIQTNINEVVASKVDKIPGKQLSTEDYSTFEKNKLSNVPTDTNQSLLMKVDKVSGKQLSTEDYTTSEKNKVANLPTDTVAVLATKTTFEEVDQKIQQLVGSAPDALNTLQEISTSLGNDSNIAGTIVSQLSTKVDKVQGKQLSTEDYTSFDKGKMVNVPVDTNSVLSSKVDKVIGKGLSANDFTNDEKNKVSNVPLDTNSVLASKVDKVTGKGLSDNNFGSVEKTKVDNCPLNTVTELSNKVDKVSGKQLSTEDYTTVEKTKLSNLQENTVLQETLNSKVDKITGKQLSTEDYSTIEKTKLGNLPEINTLQSLFDGKVDKVAGKQLSTEDYTTSEKNKVANLPTDTIAILATKANMTDVDQRFSNLIGTAPAALDTLQEIAANLENDESAISSIVTELSNKVDKVSGKQLSTEDYTSDDKTKVSNLPGNTLYELNVKVDKVDGKGLSEINYVLADKQKVDNCPIDTTTELLNKVDKIVGKDLSTNDYSNSDKSKVDNCPTNTTTELTNKVDKVTGKDLSTNDFTNDEKNKLANCPLDTVSSLSDKVDKVVGKDLSSNDYSNDDKSKVDNCPVNTTTELSNKVDKVVGKDLSSNDYSNDDKTKVDNCPVNITTELSNKQSKLYITIENTGTGIEQIIPHTLGVVPTAVFVSITSTSSTIDGKFVITEGTHTSTDILITVTTDVKFKVMVM